MSEEFIAKFINNEIISKGGDAEPINKKIDKIIEILKELNQSQSG